MSEPTPYSLATPIVSRFKGAGGEEREETISEIKIRPMNVGDMRIIGKVSNQMEQTLLLMQRLINLDARTIDKMEMADFAAISEIVEGFLPDSLKIGPKSPS